MKKLVSLLLSICLVLGCMAFASADGYIPGSIHIPLAEVEAKLPEVAPDHNTEIIFYCASGKRSQKATELAVEMGYAKVYNLGGLSDWPYEIVKD